MALNKTRAAATCPLGPEGLPVPVLAFTAGTCRSTLLHPPRVLSTDLHRLQALSSHFFALCLSVGSVLLGALNLSISQFFYFYVSIIVDIHITSYLFQVYKIVATHLHNLQSDPSISLVPTWHHT